MTPKRITTLVLILAVAGALGLFYMQNSATHVNVVFKLTPDLAWDLGPRGISLPVLLVIDFLLGIFISGLVFSGVLARGSRRARVLGRQVTALQDEIEFSRRTNSRDTRPFSAPPAADEGDFDDLL